MFSALRMMSFNGVLGIGYWVLGVGYWVLGLGCINYLGNGETIYFSLFTFSQFYSDDFI